MHRMVLETLGQSIEIWQCELASRRAKERVLLVNWLERHEHDVRTADRRDDNWKAAARAHVEDSFCVTQVRDDGEAVDDVLVDRRARASRRQIDPLIPRLEQGDEVSERCGE